MKCVIQAASVLAAICAGMPESLHAGPLQVFGGQPNWPYPWEASYVARGSGQETHGTAVEDLSFAAYHHSFRWDTNGIHGEFLPLPDPIRAGTTHALAVRYNGMGSVVGTSTGRPTLWPAGSFTPVALALPPRTPNSYFPWAIAGDISDTGHIVGGISEYSQVTDDSIERALRWNPAGTEVTVLGALSPRADGLVRSQVVKVNNAGVAVGNDRAWLVPSDPDSWRTYAVVWPADSTTPLQLGFLGAGESHVVDLNNSGLAVGKLGNGFDAVRWDTSDGTATILSNPFGDSGPFYTDTWADAINEAGVVVGVAVNPLRGGMPVRWEVDGSPFQLQTLPVPGDWLSIYDVVDINDAGWAVGAFQLRDASGWRDGGPAAWTPDGRIIRLDSVVDPDGAWELGTADYINNGNWVRGIGYYDPDGPGGLEPVSRVYEIQIPEPGVGLLVIGVLVAGCRKRWAMSDERGTMSDER